jgi:toxin ParE1/3/4
MIGYRFLSPADIEMSEASIFYEDATFGLGVEFLDEAQRVIDLVREHPKIGQSLDPQLRQAMLHRFPFSLIYAVEAETIVIVAVAHQRRRPGYWKNRI